MYLITPQAGGNCFDASAAKGGERGEIVAMVEWAIENHGVDPARVFAAGASSGACMTQALLAAYPDVFAAGAVLAGVPAGAWTGGNAYGWSTPSRSADAWGDVVRDLNPSYTGPWPRIQIWHGQGDTTLTYSQNWPGQTDQWTNVWGFAAGDGTAEQIQPPGAQDTWSRTSYVDDNGVLGVETNSGGSNVPHDLSGRGIWGDVVRFLAPDVVPGGNPGTGGTGAGGGSATGGASGTGGSGVGGTLATGGASTGGTGGAVGTGGTPSVGGSTNVGTGGVPLGSGGTPTSTGGTSAGSGGGTSGGTGGGGCSIGGFDRTSSAWALLGIAALGLMRGRRRQVG
jgi:poly(hydroxyalkanoate) depolymerase family esterase